MENLTKYDVMADKIVKLNEIVSSYENALTSLADKNKAENLNNMSDKILSNAHIVFEIEQDLKAYFSVDSNIDIINNGEISLSYVHDSAVASREMEKILLLTAIISRHDENSLDNLTLSLLCDKLPDDKDKEIIKLIEKDEYEFDMLSDEYKNMILEGHKKFMDLYIYPSVTKKESAKLEVLKGNLIFMNNVNVLNMKVDDVNLNTNRVK